MSLFALLILPVVSKAATVSVSTSGNYVVGHTYSINVLVDPQQSTVYSAKVVVNFPADILRVRGFSFESGWMPLSQTGYDSIDNTNGILIKTGGLPAGLSSSKVLGTITFYAVKSGTGNISVGSESQLLDANNLNNFTASTNIPVNVKNAAVVVAKKTVAVTQAVLANSTTVATSSTISTTSAVETPTINSIQNTAAAGNAGSNYTWPIVIGVIIVLIIIGFFVGRKR